MAKILVVDDNGDVRRLVGLTMRADGHDVVESDGGGDCLEKLKSGLRPDLIILDVMMPGVDGWAVSRTIKIDENLKGIPVCILTAKSGDLDASMSLEHAKADVHLNKPISREKLVEAVGWLLYNAGVTA